MPTRLIGYEHLFNQDFLKFDETFVNKIESSNFTYTANGKRQTADLSWEFLKIENEEIKNCVKLLIYALK